MQLIGVHDGSLQGGCLDAAGTAHDAAEIRADRLGPWIQQHVAAAQPADEMSRNLFRDATVTASSTVNDWGWLLADANDGDRNAVGWSSWPPRSTPGAEWLEFAFPAARQVNRVELYSRTDVAVAENNFPANFTIDVWTGSAWETVVSKTNYPKPAAGQRFSFPARSTAVYEIRGDGQRAGAGHRMTAEVTTEDDEHTTVTVNPSGSTQVGIGASPDNDPTTLLRLTVTG